MRASRWRRWSPRAGSWPSRPDCSARSSRRCCARRRSCSAGAGPPAHRQRHRAGRGRGRANVGSYRDLLRQIEQSREEALRALELLLGRYPAAEIAVAQRLAPMPAPVPVGPAVGPARTPARRHRRRAPRGRGLQPRRRGQGRAAAAHQPDRRRQPHLQRRAGAAGPQQPGLRLRRQPAGAAVPGWRAAGAGRDPRRRAEAGGGRLRAHRAARLRRGRERARRRDRAARARGHPGAQHRRQRTRAGTGAGPVPRRQGRPARRRAAPAGAVSARTSLLRVQTDRLAQRVNLHLALGGGFDDAAGGRWQRAEAAGHGARRIDRALAR